MQTDFCGIGGYVDKMGYDLSLTRAPIEPIKRLLAAMRAKGYPHHPHARGSSARSRRSAGQQALALAPHRRRHRRSRDRAGASWCAAKPGWDIIPELAPLPGEPIIDKPGKGSFCATDLDLMLRQRGIQNIVLTGITTDVCVHTTMREANDRGFECLLLEDCCGATDRGNHRSRAQDDQDAGRRVRRRVELAGLHRGDRMSVDTDAHHRRATAARPGPGAEPRSAGNDQALRRIHRARSCVAEGAGPARSTRCSARTAPARSTLVKCIMGYYRPDEGSVMIADREQAIENPRAAHALGLGMVYQHFTLGTGDDRDREFRAGATGAAGDHRLAQGEGRT